MENTRGAGKKRGLGGEPNRHRNGRSATVTIALSYLSLYLYRTGGNYPCGFANPNDFLTRIFHQAAHQSSETLSFVEAH